MFEVVRHIARRGASPREIHECFSWRSFPVTFHSMPGELDAQQFVDAAIAEDSEFRPQYWRAREGDVLHHGGRTYAFRRGWGRRTEEALDRLCARFEGISWSRVGRAEAVAGT